MKAAVIIVAAGASRRFGAKTPKQFMPLKGKPLFLWSVRAFKKVPAIKQVILVVPENKLRSLTPFAQQYGFQLTAGGKERIDSVKAGLALLHPSIECVAVHDGARPLVTPELIKQLLSAAVCSGAAIPAVPVKDTIKLSCDGTAVAKTIPRNEIWCAQTPQVFQRPLLEEAYRKLKDTAVTDDAQVAELSGARVTIVQGDRQNMKITERKDLELAKFYLQKKRF